MSFIRFLIVLLIIGFLFAGCSSRQSFQAESSAKEDDWWQCNPKSQREWRCTDGEEVKETVDPVASLEKPLEPIAQPIVVKDPEPAPVLEEQPVEESISGEPAESPEPKVESDYQANVIAEKISHPAHRVEGQWVIQLAALSTRADAAAFSERIIGSSIQEHQQNNKIWYRVVIEGYQNKDAAMQAVIELEQQYSWVSTWVRKKD